MDAEQNLKVKSLALTEIARRILGLKTLDAQNSDSLDFHDLHIDTICAALDAAYDAGFNSHDQATNKG